MGMKLLGLIIPIIISLCMVHGYDLPDLPFKRLVIKSATASKKLSSKNVKARKYIPKLDYKYKGATKKQPADAGSVPIGIDEQITGGARAAKKKFPWQILLVGDDSWICGGSLISTEWVLTAAHCIFGGTNFMISAGGVITKKFKEKGEQVWNSTTAIYHEEYNETTAQNDIGLVQVSFKFDQFVSAIRLPKYSQATNAFAGIAVVISGYGQTSDSSSASRFLKFANMKTITNAQCAILYDATFVTDSVICIGPEKVKSACFGDSGGPLMMRESDKKYTIIGTVSGGPEKCVGYISTFARVTSFLGWISEKTSIAIEN
ncbi:Hypothetical predicted protein [Cloeon dipterum]|nr:Hypothetical predicted protein [Cloeon dipterum]